MRDDKQISVDNRASGGGGYEKRFHFNTKFNSPEFSVSCNLTRNKLEKHYISCFYNGYMNFSADDNVFMFSPNFFHRRKKSTVMGCSAVS